jgi:S1-C subfamily serine protease
MPEATPRNRPARFLRKLSHGVAGARTGAVEAATIEALAPSHAERALERAVAAIEKERGMPLDAAEHAELTRLFMEDGTRAIESLKRAGVNARLDPPQEDALEAIVELNGSRPTVALSEDDRIDLSDDSLGQWQAVARSFEPQISRVASAVGRIDVDGRHVGTGFAVKDGVILTNRHVLQALAEPDSHNGWTFLGQPTITFDANPATARSRQFAIRKQVVLAGANAIDPALLDFDKLDFAILECEPVDGAAFPAALPLEGDPDKVVVGRPIFTIGYPAPPPFGVYVYSVLERLFRHRYGVKRFAPGEIERGIGNAADGTGETVFVHDATTLGGNSGSCVVDLGNDGRLVVGLHFAGTPKEANYAHANARLRPTLASVDLTWKDWM